MENAAQRRLLAGCGTLMLLVLFALGTAICWWGAREFQEAREFPKPETISFSALVQRRPDHGWFRVTGGSLFIQQGFWEEEVGAKDIKRAFVPLLSAAMPQMDRVQVLVETKDPTVLAAMEQKRNSAQQPRGMPSMGGFAQIWMPRDVEARIPGLNRVGVIGARARSMNVGVAGRFAADMVYLAEGEAPASGAAFGAFVIGSSLIVLVVAVFVKMMQEQRAKPGWRSP